MDDVRTISDIVSALRTIGVEGPAVAADVLAAIGGYTVEERDEILRRMSRIDQTSEPGS